MKTIENVAHFFLSNGMARPASAENSIAPYQTAAQSPSDQSFVASQAKDQRWKKICVRLVLFASFNSLTMGMAGCADESNPQASPRILSEISAQIRSQLGTRSVGAPSIDFGSNAPADSMAQNTLIESVGINHDLHMAWPVAGF